MLKTESPLMAKMRALQPAMKAAHEKSTREALLEHARLGFDICEGRDGKVVSVSPAEIFARYGLDEFGRPVPSATT